MQTIFSRNEKKYQITQHKAAQLVEAISNKMKPGKYGTYWVQNLFFDTDNWDIIHTSMEKPHYKEKMRLRCYGTPETTDRMFLEFKKKYDGVVYKRRFPIVPAELANYTINEILSRANTQIAKELVYHIQQKGVTEKFYISYNRQEFTGVHDEDLRLTIDSNISYRLDSLFFTQPQLDCSALDPNKFLLEIKMPLSIPLWLSHILSDLGIFASSFSKYAACFTDWSTATTKKKVIKIA